MSDGQDLSTTELVRGMAQAAGVPARLLPVPVWALQAGATLLGKGNAVHRLCGNLQVDMSKARSLLGWVPPVSVEEGLWRAMGGEWKTHENDIRSGTRGGGGLTRVHHTRSEMSWSLQSPQEKRLDKK